MRFFSNWIAKLWATSNKDVSEFRHYFSILSHSLYLTVEFNLYREKFIVLLIAREKFMCIVC
jgi:hypothetical protein